MNIYQLLLLSWFKPVCSRRAKSIGVLILHLATREIFYQANTFEGKDLSEEMKRKWGPAGDLGDAGRKTIKGHDCDYYLGILKETREKSLAEFAKRDVCMVDGGG